MTLIGGKEQQYDNLDGVGVIAYTDKQLMKWKCSPNEDIAEFKHMKYNPILCMYEMIIFHMHAYTQGVVD